MGQEPAGTAAVNSNRCHKNKKIKKERLKAQEDTLSCHFLYIPPKSFGF